MYFEFENNGEMCLAKLPFIKGVFAMLFGKKVCRRVPKSKIILYS